MTDSKQSDKQSSSTPRTDAEIMYPGSGIAMVRPEFARQLERELAEAKAAVNVAMHNHAEAENRAPRPPLAVQEETAWLIESVKGRWGTGYAAPLSPRAANVTTTREQVQDTLDKANDIDIALERGTTVSDDQLSIQRNLLQDLCLLALAPPHRHLKRELAEAQRYDKRVCDALGMKTVDPEEALNVIDGLRERLQYAEGLLEREGISLDGTRKADAELDRILSMTDEEVRQSLIAEGINPELAAENTKYGLMKVLERVQLGCENERLRERLRAAERDAARYRWLREANSIMPGKPRVQPIEWYCGTAVDNAIDAAMKEGK